MRQLKLSLFCLACCGPQAHIELPTDFVIIDSKFNDVAITVLQALNAQDNNIYQWEGEPIAGQTIIQIVGTTEGWGPAGGTSRYDGNIIYLDAKMNPKWEHLPFAIMHELGHTRGLCHSKDPNNIMYYSTQSREHTLEQSARDILSALYSGGNCN